MMSTIPTPPIPSYAPLKLGAHVLAATAIGIVAPFTGLAWPFALLVGMMLGSDDARRMRGERNGVVDSIANVVLVAFGFLAMLLFGAIVGGLIAIVVVVLASFSERAAADASPTDRGVARILLFIVPVAMWLVVFPILGLNVDIRIGS